MAVQAQLAGVISLTDNLAGSTQMQKSINLSYLGTISEFAQSQQIGTSPTTIPLPGASVQFLYIKNLSANATLTVTWTPNGGAQAQVLPLQPGSLILFLESNSVSGITSLSLQASSAGTPCEYLLVS